MSIYSGFATRQIEQTYNIMVEQLLRVLSKRILKFYRQEETNELVFIDCMKKLLTQLSFFERQKHLPPKFSDNCRELSTFLKIRIPSNVSVFCQKKNKSASQKQLAEKIDNEQIKTIEQSQQPQNKEINTPFYGEPKKSEINFKKYPNNSNSIFSTIQERNDKQRQFKNEQEQVHHDLLNETQNLQQETRQNCITLEAAYNNSSSSASPSNSLHSSFTSLNKKLKNQQIQYRTQQQQMVINKVNNSKDIQWNSGQLITNGQKNIIQQNNENTQNNNTTSFNLGRDIKTITTQYQMRDYSSSGQNNMQDQEKARDRNNNKQSLFRVKNRQPQDLNQFSPISSSQVPQNLQTHKSLLVSKQFIIPEESKEQSVKMQSIENNDVQTFPYSNKKKNKRSLTTKRQRKKNLLLNQVYLNGEDSSNHQFGSQTAVVVNGLSRRSRSSYRSSENTQRNNQQTKQQKQQQEKIFIRSNSIDNQKSIDHLTQLGLMKSKKESLFNSHVNSVRNNSFSNYNPTIQSTINKENSYSSIIKRSGSDNKLQQIPIQGSSIQVVEPTATLSDATIYSIRSQMGEHLKQENSIHPIQMQNEGSFMSQQKNSRIEKYNIIMNRIETEQDIEPQISMISYTKHNQAVNKNNLAPFTSHNQQKYINNNNNSNFELNSQNQNRNSNKTPQKLRTIQNNSLNNSIQNQQNNARGNNKTDQSLLGKESSNFDLMYQNKHQSKRPSGSQIYSQQYPNTLTTSNSSKNKLNTTENGTILKTQTSGFDQSITDDNMNNINPLNNINYLKRENISPSSTKKALYKLFVQKPQQERHQSFDYNHNKQSNKILFKDNKILISNKFNNISNKQNNDN